MRAFSENSGEGSERRFRCPALTLAYAYRSCVFTVGFVGQRPSSPKPGASPLASNAMGNWLANGQHQPTRFGLNLAVGQNGSEFSWSRGVAHWLC